MKKKPNALRFGGLFSKGERASDVYKPTNRNASAEALICLTCPLPAEKCNLNCCKRYKEEMLKLKGCK